MHKHLAVALPGCSCHDYAARFLCIWGVVGISLTELLVVFVVALVLFGPDKLPELARHLGHLTGQLKKTSDGIRREIYNTVYPPGFDIRKGVSNELSELRNLKAQVLAPPVGSVSAQSNRPAPPASPSAQAPQSEPTPPVSTQPQGDA